ncbi:hypothetical protein A2576_03070 [Candidatus Amesbacteria bacterium RIFOXYD1_FULL_47_9]|uniref:Uncharacterized protein n=2 Tax=Candidatus Amesiibacteriota TaxID=1752730 RepID=A0A1F5A2X3_9BACT|nr:MAG: hypothetical protein UX78_C0031G0004 [Candidatus Amesbacteria bacterium GW2011_GWA2_47_11]OGD02605.1 MAG: hypothetical protein A2354_02050 [Candidatus Amesbacteria bacterium RIFOXYB1_FULL_47_12]OGD12935.1 MAG: hypothetical protein A2576_03070 [Candidatus Amesbacteria bacterium RIFOXYD1_FULL_47_9]
MIRATNSEELIKATGAFIINQNTVRLAGGREVSLVEFERQAKSFIYLVAADENEAAYAVQIKARRAPSCERIEF